MVNVQRSTLGAFGFPFFFKENNMSNTMSKLLKKLKEQWKQPSTLQGITVVASLVGVTLDPAQTEAIVAVGSGVFALISIFVSEGDGKSSKDK